jgi:acetyl esterase/lipase
LIARAASAPVLSVDYRLAPEHRFPVGYRDALAAYHWARENAARFGAAVGKAAVGGDSIGGQFAAAITLEERPQHTPALQLLIYPMLDYLADSDSMRDFADAFPLTGEAYDFYKRHYLPDGADPSETRLSPGHGQNLSGLPRTLLYTAGFDMLLDQGEAYADRLAAAGVPLSRHCFETLPHGFVAYPTASPAAEAALQHIARDTGEALKRV